MFNCAVFESRLLDEGTDLESKEVRFHRNKVSGGRGEGLPTSSPRPQARTAPVL